MKYLDHDKLEIGKYYHCVTYADEDVVLKLYNHNDWRSDFSCGLSDLDIRYVLCEKEDLREERKQFE